MPAALHQMEKLQMSCSVGLNNAWLCNSVAEQQQQLNVPLKNTSEMSYTAFITDLNTLGCTLHYNRCTIRPPMKRRNCPFATNVRKTVVSWCDLTHRRFPVLCKYQEQ